MDCHRSLLLALGLLGGLAGCGPQGSALPVASPSATPIPPGAEVRKEKDADQARRPLPSTCVAFGEFREQMADERERTPAEREQMYAQARRAYQQALEADPKNLAALQSLARLYVKSGDHEHAVATYQRAVTAYPKNAVLWFDLGMCHARQKQWDPAIEALTKALELDPENRQFASVLGYTLARAGRFDESLACFTQTLGRAKAHFNLARMHYHLKQEDLCKQHLRLAAEADPNFAAARDMLAQLEGRGPAAVIQVGLEPSEDVLPADTPPAGN